MIWPWQKKKTSLKDEEPAVDTPLPENPSETDPEPEEQPLPDQEEFFLANYEEQGDKTKMLFLLLLLNTKSSDFSDVDLEMESENRGFGIKLRRVFATTSQDIDTVAIEKELNALPLPVVCTKASFGHYFEGPVLYRYTPQHKDKPLVINDISVASSVMLIEENMVVSSKKATPLTSLKAGQMGFPLFCKYVLRDHVEIGDWNITFQPETSTFIVKHKHHGLLYQSVELDKTATYKLVLYILKKLSPMLDAEEDNFVVRTYERKKGL